MMAFDAERILLIGAVKIELPNYTINICDGGFVDFQGARYTSEDTVFGIIESVEDIAGSSNDAAPGGSLTFVPKSSALAGVLSAPGMQSSPMTLYQLEVDYDTGAVNNFEIMASARLDNTVLRGGLGERQLEMSYISSAEWLFSMNEGNTLSATFHDEIWPGERGFDNVTGVGITVAWGTASPPRTASSGGGGGGGPTVFGSSLTRFIQQ